MKKLLFFLSAIMMLTACKSGPKNPLMQEWDTPYGVPPFEKIQASDYLPAIQAGISQQNDEIQAIIENQENPTFENTIDALDHSGALLTKAALVLMNVVETDKTPELTEVMGKVLPLLSEQNSVIYMNKALFERVAEVKRQAKKEEYTKEQMRTLDIIYNTFVRNGIDLDAEKQERLKVINSKLSVLYQTFSDNVLAETNAFQLILSTPEELAGLPQGVLDAASLAAKEAGLEEGKYLFGLTKPSWIPFLTYSSRRDLRKKMFDAYANRCIQGGEHDNQGVIMDIMKLSIEKANLLGFKSPAAYILDDTMAKTPEAVDTFLKQIMDAAVVKAQEEVAEMQAIVDREGGDFKIQSYDWDYYSNKVRQEKYALSEEEVKPYFQMEKVRAGVFGVAEKLYGIKIEPLKDMPIYNPDVECFKVSDTDGSLIGIFYTDYYPRASKRGGAWMTNFVNQTYKNGVEQRPVIVNVGNFTKPTADKPSLLTIDEVETMFHEFGHALHGLFASAHYNTVSGTNVSRDFVEFPSQINENWAFEPEVLKMYAKHYETGEVIPDELVQKIQNVATFNQGFMTTELTAAAILDMKWYELESLDGIEDVAIFEKEEMAKAGLIKEIIPRYRSTYFSHIFTGGYSAGYYSYLWAEVLDKDGFAYFKENGIFNQEIAAKLRHVLSTGGAEEPMELYRGFRGQAPSTEPMLIGRGLK